MVEWMEVVVVVVVVVVVRYGILLAKIKRAKRAFLWTDRHI